MRALEKSDSSFESADLPEPLTDRERTILRLLAGGYSNKEIGDLLNITDGTVKNHISNLLAKLGVRDRTRTVLRAIDLGVI
jgi:DNA-binding NarL/FixJ family response regulator